MPVWRLKQVEKEGLIGQARQDDGYLNTYFTVQEPGQVWSNL
ncbi:hypothetical protein KB449_09640 [Cohnella sp. F6_2S_P_1]|uniref:Uncharacterized protein n=1 Tax=Cohnella hashimotonis TaxID=2826895 RepID=A0ABT6TEG0_9BACL|nr:hypothetical protein [Cohnella hashimotonis]MDI4645223.1 hypothetical protein [Cohnella hashimotonis]